ncbi:MAG: hypothetical protein ACK4K0_07855 [Flavobacteriales bacterium]
MRISILIFLVCFSKLSFGQITYPFSSKSEPNIFGQTKRLFYTYNNNQDTIYFNNPTSFEGFTVCEVKLVDTVDINNSGLKECVFIKTCEVKIGEHGGTFDITGELKISTFEIWDLDNKVQLFSANFSYNHHFRNFSAYRSPTHWYGYNVYQYNVSLVSDIIIISNLEMEPSKNEIDSTLKQALVINEIEVDNEIGIYQFDGKGFVKQSDIETIKIIFNEFVLNQESTDSKVNKELMSNCLKSITLVIDKNELDLLINVWMYYDPTDYPDIPEIYRILKDSRPHSIEAVKNRIDNKKEWETDDTAPYSDLKNLLQRLENE